MVWKKKAHRPNAMVVDFGMFHRDSLLCRGRIRIEESEKWEEFDYYSGESADGVTHETKPRGHLLIRHQFGLPTASLDLFMVQFETERSGREVILEAGVAMDVHDSEDWESVALGKEHTLAFLCRRELESPAK
jgi:hypothetical protein